jgi:hypothetical protein
VAAKLVLFSVVIMMIALPILTSRDTSPRRGLQRTLLLVIAFNVIYLLAVRFIYPRLL